MGICATQSACVWSSLCMPTIIQVSCLNITGQTWPWHHLQTLFQKNEDWMTCMVSIMCVCIGNDLIVPYHQSANYCSSTDFLLALAQYIKTDVLLFREINVTEHRHHSKCTKWLHIKLKLTMYV